MKCQAPELNEKLYSYLEKLLPEAQELKVKEHLAICEVCQKEAALLREITGKLKKCRISLACPSIEELISHTLNPDPLISSHAENCPACREVLEYLSEYENEVAKCKIPSMSNRLRRAFKADYGKQEDFSFFSILRQPAFKFASILLVLVLGLWFYVAEFNNTPESKDVGDMAGAPSTSVVSKSGNQESGVRSQKSEVRKKYKELPRDEGRRYENTKIRETKGNNKLSIINKPVSLPLKPPAVAKAKLALQKAETLKTLKETAVKAPQPAQVKPTKTIAITPKTIDKAQKPALSSEREVVGSITNAPMENKAVNAKIKPSLIKISRQAPAPTLEKASPTQKYLTPAESKTLAPAAGAAKAAQTQDLSQERQFQSQSGSGRMEQLKDFNNPTRDIQTSLTKILNKEVQIEYQHTTLNKNLKIYTAMSLTPAEKNSCQALLKEKFSFSAKDSVIFLTP
jgi:hypothetical protein